jgi:FkbM family methyltransferase
MTGRSVEWLHDLLRARHVDVVRFRPETHWLARRWSLLQAWGVDLVVDVGANDGEYATSLRRLGYRGRIVSFEPLPDAAARLRDHHALDPRWTSHELGLGDVPGTAELHVAGNSASSSFLPMLASHEEHAPESAFVGSTTVRIATLDELADKVIADARRPFLKIDTQGYEQRVLDGARRSIGRFVGIQLELSIEPLYDGAPGYLEMLRTIDELGFVLMGIEPGFSDRKTGRMLQFDALAFRPPTDNGSNL